MNEFYHEKRRKARRISPQRFKALLLTATICVMGGAIIIMFSQSHYGFYDVFTRIVDVPGYLFLALIIYNFINCDGGVH
jgi:hypothetical protein